MSACVLLCLDLTQALRSWHHTDGAQAVVALWPSVSLLAVAAAQSCATAGTTWQGHRWYMKSPTTMRLWSERLVGIRNMVVTTGSDGGPCRSAFVLLM